MATPVFYNNTYQTPQAAAPQAEGNLRNRPIANMNYQVNALRAEIERDGPSPSEIKVEKALAIAATILGFALAIIGLAFLPSPLGIGLLIAGLVIFTPGATACGIWVDDWINQPRRIQHLANNRFINWANDRNIQLNRQNIDQVIRTFKTHGANERQREEITREIQALQTPAAA